MIEATSLSLADIYEQSDIPLLESLSKPVKENPTD